MMVSKKRLLLRVAATVLITVATTHSLQAGQYLGRVLRGGDGPAWTTASIYNDLPSDRPAPMPSDATSDLEAMNDLLANSVGDGPPTSAFLFAKFDGRISGPMGQNLSVVEADGTTAFAAGSSSTARWTLSSVPPMSSSIFYLTQVAGFWDIWQFSGTNGDSFVDNGDGTYDLVSGSIFDPMADPNTPYAQPVMGVSVWGNNAIVAAIPEASSFAIWGLVGAVALGLRKRHPRG